MDTFVEELVERMGGSYDLVVAAAERAKQLRDGARPLVDIESKNTLTIALREIAEGKIILKPPDEDAVEEAEEHSASDYLERRGSIGEVRDNAQDEDDEEQVGALGA